jgi:hypothetical protein
MTEIVFRNDRDWSVIDAEPCRVKAFTPWARVEKGQVVAFGGMTAPYASIEIECDQLPDGATGFITHQIDFLHLWSAFNERGVAEDEEVIVFWTKKKLRTSARLFSTFMPKLWVLIFPKGAFDLMNDPNSMPELTDAEYRRLQSPLVDWKPDVMT